MDCAANCEDLVLSKYQYLDILSVQASPKQELIFSCGIKSAKENQAQVYYKGDRKIP